MTRRTLKFITLLALCFLTINIFLALITNVPTHVTDSDETVFQYALNLEKPYSKLNYDQEITLILAVQAAVLDKVPFGTPIVEYESREPKDLFKQKSGLCYDRSRTYDKVFAWLGLETRHVYILYPEHPVTGIKMPFLNAFFTRGTATHAVTEVRTSRGWLVVDSNSKWVSSTVDGTPIDADHLNENAHRFSKLPAYFQRDYWAIRGMYSRRGQFYRPYVPYPELNWADFFLWTARSALG